MRDLVDGANLNGPGTVDQRAGSGVAGGGTAGDLTKGVGAGHLQAAEGLMYLMVLS